MTEPNPLIAFSINITECFSKYIEALQSELNVSDDTLREILTQSEFMDILDVKVITGSKSRKLVGDKDKNDKNDKEAGKKEKKEKKERKEKKDKPPEETRTCIATIKLKARFGEECGKKVSLKSESKNYCGVHLKQETVKQEEKIPEDVAGDIFRLNKQGNFVFGETGLVLKNEKEKIVIGKQTPDGVIDLSEDDIQLCQLRKFRSAEFLARDSANVYLV